MNIAKYGPLRESIKTLLSISDKFAILQGLLLLLLKQDRAQTRFNINPIQGGGGTERANVDFNHSFFSKFQYLQNVSNLVTLSR